MATFRKRGDAWQAMIRLAGHSPESASFDTRAEAKGWAEEREEELRTGRLADIRGITLAHALRRYARDVSPTKRGVRWEKLRLNKFEREAAIAHSPLANITTAALAAWRDGRLKQVAPATVAREMNLLRSVLEVARKEWQWLKTNPITDVKRPKAPPARRRRISPQEIKNMCEALGYRTGKPRNTSQRIALSFLFALETAMRAGEILGLQWPDVHLTGRYVTLPRTKNGDTRHVPLSKRAVAILQLLKSNSSRVFDVAPALRDALFRKARNKAEIVDLHFHDSRAEAIWRLSKKLDVLQLAKMIGHRDIRSLMFYYSESASDMAKQLD